MNSENTRNIETSFKLDLIADLLAVHLYNTRVLKPTEEVDIIFKSLSKDEGCPVLLKIKNKRAVRRILHKL